MSSDPERLHLVVVGCSWGGLYALSAMMETVPASLPATIVVAQHRLHTPSNLAELLARHTTWPVCEVDDKAAIAPQRVYLAPPGYHLLVDGDRFALSTEGPVRHSRPSVDVLFESAADAFTSGVVGIVLTGANEDGAAGLARIVRRGGVAIVQDPDTAEKAAMPEAALAKVPTAIVARLEDIGPRLVEIVDAGVRHEQRSTT